MHNFLACAIISYDGPHFHLADTAHSAARSRRPLYYNTIVCAHVSVQYGTFALKCVYRFTLQVNLRQHVTYMTSYMKRMTL